MTLIPTEPGNDAARVHFGKFLSDVCLNVNHHAIATHLKPLQQCGVVGIFARRTGRFLKLCKTWGRQTTNGCNSNGYCVDRPSEKHPGLTDYAWRPLPIVPGNNPGAGDD